MFLYNADYKGYLARKKFKVRLEKARKEKKELEEMLRQASQLSMDGYSQQQALHEHDKTRLQGQIYTSIWVVSTKCTLIPGNASEC